MGFYLERKYTGRGRAKEGDALVRTDSELALGFTANREAQDGNEPLENTLPEETLLIQHQVKFCAMYSSLLISNTF